MTTTPTRIGPVGTCPSCGHHTAHAWMVPIHAYGTEGGSWEVTGYDCGHCGHEWPAP